MVSVGSKFWHNCKCEPLGPKNAGGRAQCLCWGTARSDRAANHALAAPQCREPARSAPAQRLVQRLLRSKHVPQLCLAPAHECQSHACSGALTRACCPWALLRSITGLAAEPVPRSTANKPPWINEKLLATSIPKKMSTHVVL